MQFIQNKLSLKWLTVFVLIALLFFLKNALNFLLLTFIFTYLAYTIFTKILHIIPPKWQMKKSIIVIMYSIVLFVIGFAGYRYLPVAVQQFSAIVIQGSSFNLQAYESVLPVQIYDLLNNLDMGGMLESIGAKALAATTGISTLLLEAFVAILLSFFFLFELDKIKSFSASLRTTDTAKIYDQVAAFGQSFLNTFGIAIKVQIMISTVNTVLSIIGLVLLGFPNIIGLAIMIFFLGLMPVIGVVISLVPLSIIAFQIGGAIYVVYMIIMIMVIHAIESYFLNPKLYSITMKLPIFYTFIVLMVGELLFGAWGLVIGIPLFVFIVGLIKGDPFAKEAK
ncbi:MAG: AI-2E family transporter [Caryophanon sp.]|nr:AI-2E family transporter [Caryophanon sp.]